jgi:inorganic triphosphatase YgiF
MQDDQTAEPREFELKLEIDPSHIDRFKHHRFFQPAIKPRQLRAVYFDTAKFALRDNGISFRIRQDGEKQVQTIKAERPRTGLALDRGEWENELPSAEPDFSKAARTPLQAFVQDGASQRIKPVFTVLAERLVGRCGLNGAEIELALDNARIEAEDRRGAFAEIELELRSGEPKSLYAAALDLAQSGPVRLSMQTKSGRGYALLANSAPTSVKAEKLVLRAGQSTAEAFQIIANSCLRQLVENEAILRAAANPEAVHQARVAIRRLRAAISIFRTAVADNEVGEIKARLKAMADPLGAARDLDVFIAKVLKPARKSDKAVGTLMNEYRKRRDAAYVEALGTVASDKFGLDLLMVATWIETGPWLSETAPTRGWASQGSRGNFRGRRDRPALDQAAQAAQGYRRGRRGEPPPGPDRDQEAALRHGVLFRAVSSRRGKAASRRAERDRSIAIHTRRPERHRRCTEHGGRGRRPIPRRLPANRPLPASFQQRRSRHASFAPFSRFGLSFPRAEGAGEGAGQGCRAWPAAWSMLAWRIQDRSRALFL